jgi:hypothetical protein
LAPNFHIPKIISIIKNQNGIQSTSIARKLANGKKQINTVIIITTNYTED